MRILFLCHGFNSLSQRLYSELGARGIADFGDLLCRSDHALRGFLRVLGAQGHHRVACRVMGP